MNDIEIDFLTELKLLSNCDTSTDNGDPMSNDNVCLISLEPLDNNHITLKCGHKFNYMPIYNYLLNNNANCPYCSSVHCGRLPVRRVNGKYVIDKHIHLPLKLCINDEHKCKTCASTHAFNGACIRCHRYLVKLLENADEETRAMVEKLIANADEKMQNALITFMKSDYADMFDDYILSVLTKKYLLMLFKKYNLDAEIDLKRLNRYEIVSFIKLV